MENLVKLILGVFPFWLSTKLSEHNSKVKINYGLEFYQFKNDGYDIFWNKKRKGNIKSLFYSLCIDKFKEKISPCLNIRYEENTDSIRFYSYSNFFMSFSFKY